MLKYIQEVLQTLWRESSKTKLKLRKARGNSFDITKGKTSIKPEMLAPDVGNEKHSMEHSKEIIKLKKTYDILMKKFVNPRLDLISPSIKTLEQMKILDLRGKQSVISSSISNLFVSGKHISRKLPSLPENSSGENSKPSASDELSYGWSGQPTDKHALNPKVETSVCPRDIASAFFTFPEIEELNSSKTNKTNKGHKKVFKKMYLRKQYKNPSHSENSKKNIQKPVQLIKKIPKSHVSQFYEFDEEKHNKEAQTQTTGTNQDFDIDEPHPSTDARQCMKNSTNNVTVNHFGADIKNESSPRENNINETSHSLSNNSFNLRVNSSIMQHVHEELSPPESSKHLAENVNYVNGKTDKSLKMDDEKHPLFVRDLKDSEHLVPEHAKSSITNYEADRIDTEGNKMGKFNIEDDFSTSHHKYLNSFSDLENKQNHYKVFDFGNKLVRSLKGTKKNNLQISNVRESDSNIKKEKGRKWNEKHDCGKENIPKEDKMAENKNALEDYLKSNVKNITLKYKIQSPKSSKLPPIQSLKHTPQNIASSENDNQNLKSSLVDTLKDNLSNTKYNEISASFGKDGRGRIQLVQDKCVNKKSKKSKYVQKLGLQDMQGSNIKKEIIDKTVDISSQQSLFQSNTKPKFENKKRSPPTKIETIAKAEYTPSDSQERNVKNKLGNQDTHSVLTSTTKAVTEKGSQKSLGNSISNKNINTKTNISTVKTVSITNKRNTLSNKLNDCVGSPKSGRASNMLVIKPTKITKNEVTGTKSSNDLSTTNITCLKKHKPTGKEEKSTIVIQNDYLKFVKNKAWYYDYFKVRARKSETNLVTNKGRENSITNNFINDTVNKRAKEKVSQSKSKQTIGLDGSTSLKLKLPGKSKSSNDLKRVVTRKNILKTTNSIIRLKDDKKENRLTSRTNKGQIQKICIGKIDFIDKKSRKQSLLDYSSKNVLFRNKRKSLEIMSKQLVPKGPSLVQSTHSKTEKRNTKIELLNTFKEIEPSAIDSSFHHASRNIVKKKTSPVLLSQDNTDIASKFHRLPGIDPCKTRKLHSKKPRSKSVNLKMYGSEKNEDVDRLPDSLNSLKSVQIVYKREKNKNPYKLDPSTVSLKKSLKNKSCSVQPRRMMFPANIQTRNLTTIEYKANIIVNYLWKRYATTVTNQNKTNKTVIAKNNSNSLYPAETVNSISKILRKSKDIRSVIEAGYFYKFKSNRGKIIEPVYESNCTQDASLASKSQCSLRKTGSKKDTAFKQKEQKLKSDNKEGTESPRVKHLGDIGVKSQSLYDTEANKKDYNIEVLFSRQEENRKQFPEKPIQKKVDKMYIDSSMPEGDHNALSNSKKSSTNNKEHSDNLNHSSQKISRVQEKCIVMPPILNIKEAELAQSTTLKSNPPISNQNYKVDLKTQNIIDSSCKQMSYNLNQNIKDTVRKIPTSLKEANTCPSIRPPISNTKLNKEAKINNSPVESKCMNECDMTIQNSENVDSLSLLQIKKDLNTSGDSDRSQKWKSKTDRLNGRSSRNKESLPEGIQLKKRTQIKSIVCKDIHLDTTSPEKKLNIKLFNKTNKKTCGSFNTNEQTKNTCQPSHKKDEKISIPTKLEGNTDLETQKKGLYFKMKKSSHVEKSSSELSNVQKLVENSQVNATVSEISKTNRLSLRENAVKDSTKLTNTNTVVNVKKSSDEKATKQGEKSTVPNKVVLTITGTAENKKLLRKHENLIINVPKLNVGKGLIQKPITDLSNLQEKNTELPKNRVKKSLFSPTLSLKIPPKTTPKSKTFVLKKQNQNKDKIERMYQSKLNNDSVSIKLLQSDLIDIKYISTDKPACLTVNNVTKPFVSKKINEIFFKENIKKHKELFSTNNAYNINKSSNTLHEGLLRSVKLTKSIASLEDNIAKQVNVNVPKVIQGMSYTYKKPQNVKTDSKGFSLSLTEMDKLNSKIKNVAVKVPSGYQIKNKEPEKTQIQTSDNSYNINEKPRKQIQIISHPIEKETYNLKFDDKVDIPLQNTLPSEIKVTNNNLNAGSDNQTELSPVEKYANNRPTFTSKSEKEKYTAVNKNQINLTKQNNLKSWKPGRSVTLIKDKGCERKCSMEIIV